MLIIEILKTKIAKNKFQEKFPYKVYPKMKIDEFWVGDPIDPLYRFDLAQSTRGTIKADDNPMIMEKRFESIFG